MDTSRNTFSSFLNFASNWVFNLDILVEKWFNHTIVNKSETTKWRKKEKESRKKQKVINVKEIRLTPSIDKHDIEVKAKHANNFLKGGDKVKVSVRFRGRELGHTDIGKVVLNQFKELTEEFGNVEKDSVMEGRNMTMFLSPKQD